MIPVHCAPLYQLTQVSRKCTHIMHNQIVSVSKTRSPVLSVHSRGSRQRAFIPYRDLCPDPRDQDQTLSSPLTASLSLSHDTPSSRVLSNFLLSSSRHPLISTVTRAIEDRDGRAPRTHREKRMGEKEKMRAGAHTHTHTNRRCMHARKHDYSRKDLVCMSKSERRMSARLDTTDHLLILPLASSQAPFRHTYTARGMV